MTLDARGRVRFTAMLYVPKGETSNTYKVLVNIRDTRRQAVRAGRV